MFLKSKKKSEYFLYLLYDNFFSIEYNDGIFLLLFNGL